MNYSSPIWHNSAHVKKVDVQLNSALRIISGTLKGTLLNWLYVLSNIPPPELTRKKAFKNIIEKCIIHGNSLLYKILEEPVKQRLKSRKTWYNTYKNVRNFVLNNEWKIAWEFNVPVNSHLILDPSFKVPGLCETLLIQIDVIVDLRSKQLLTFCVVPILILSGT